MLSDFFSNKALWTSAFTFLIAQGIKFILGYYAGRNTKLSHFFGTGGMPSSHSATVTALATIIGLKDGWGSGNFAIAAIFCAVVLYDATNIRRAAGNNAATINKLVDHFEEDLKEKPPVLNTHLGHSNLEVSAGVILGIAISVVSYYFI